MTESSIYGVNQAGVMELAGHDVRELMAEYGSPLIVLLEDVIRKNCQAYCQSLVDYPRPVRVYYASKAFLTTGFCKLMESEGMGLDVASWGELQTALAAGFPPERILMHGNAKTVEDLSLALEVGVGRIIVDNESEIERLASLAEQHETQVKVLLRITPGIKPSTHSYIQTGQIDSKFGFNLAGGAAERAIRKVLTHPRLTLIGLHCHIGSQIAELEPFTVAAKVMMELYAKAQQEWGAPLEELNLGGGLGIRYMPDDLEPSVTKHLVGKSQVVLEMAEALGIEPPVLLDEPGRSIVGRAGVTLYTVQSIKQIPGVRNYASVDGGMTDNPRYALYNAKYEVLLANQMQEQATGLWSISGRCCESGDMLQRDVNLPQVAVDDVLAFLSTGAYTYSMASNYNRVVRPAVVLVKDGQVGELAAREQAKDLVHLDRVPAWLS